MEAEKKARKVEKAEYVVESRASEADGWIKEGVTIFDGTTSAKAWIKQHAEEGMQYRIIRICWSGSIVKAVKTVRKLS